MRERGESEKVRKTVYKVVREFGGRYYSAIVYGTAKLEYRVGEIIRPIVKGSPIMAFMDYESAEHFRAMNSGSHDPMVILKCDAMVEENADYISCAIPCSIEDVISFWHRYSGGKFITSNIPAPNGTVFCSELRPIEEGMVR